MTNVGKDVVSYVLKTAIEYGSIKDLVRKGCFRGKLMKNGYKRKAIRTLTTNSDRLSIKTIFLKLDHRTQGELLM